MKERHYKGRKGEPYNEGHKGRKDDVKEGRKDDVLRKDDVMGGRKRKNGVKEGCEGRKVGLNEGRTM